MRISKLTEFNSAYWSALRGQDTGFPFKNLLPCSGAVLDPVWNKRLQNARTKFAQFDSKTEHLLLFYDSSMFHNGNLGFVLTDHFLYCGEWGLFSPECTKISIDNVSEIEFTNGGMQYQGNKILSIPHLSDFDSNLLENLILRDYFVAIQSLKFDPSILRAFIDPSCGSELMKFAEKKGASMNVMIVINNDQIQNESVVKCIDDFIVTTHRIIKLPNSQIRLTKDTCLIIKKKFSEPHLLHHHPSHSPQDPLTTAAILAAKIVFNELSKGNHKRKLLRYEGQFKKYDPVFPREEELDYSVNLSWVPSDESKMLQFAKDFSSAGIQVLYDGSPIETR